MAIGQASKPLGAFTAATRLVYLHPFWAVLGLGAALLIGLGVASQFSTRGAINLAHVQEGLLEKADQAHPADLQRIERLRDLAGVEKLSNQQMAEARAVIDDLRAPAESACRPRMPKYRTAIFDQSAPGAA